MKADLYIRSCVSLLVIEVMKGLLMQMKEQHGNSLIFKTFAPIFSPAMDL